MTPVTCYIGIGANLGSASDTVRTAIARLACLPTTRLEAQSSLFRTAPVDAGGDDYINAVARIETSLDAVSLLHELHVVENQLGRNRPYRNAPRTIDLDLLLYGQEIITNPALTVPHPRMTQRAFALIPLLQIDPLIHIPGHGPAHRFVPDVAGQSIARL